MGGEETIENLNVKRPDVLPGAENEETDCRMPRRYQSEHVSTKNRSSEGQITALCEKTVNRSAVTV